MFLNYTPSFHFDDTGNLFHGHALPSPFEESGIAWNDWDILHEISEEHQTCTWVGELMQIENEREFYYTQERIAGWIIESIYNKYMNVLATTAIIKVARIVNSSYILYLERDAIYEYRRDNTFYQIASGFPDLYSVMEIVNTVASSYGYSENPNYDVIETASVNFLEDMKDGEILRSIFE